MDEYFAYISKLIDECDRRCNNADKKVASYVCSRLKSCISSLNLLKLGKSNNVSFLSEVIEDDIIELIQLLNNILTFWEKVNANASEDTKKASLIVQFKAVKNYHGGKGRPPYVIDLDIVSSLLDLSFNWKEVSKILGVSRITLWRHLTKSGFDFDRKYTDISDEDLDKIIADFKKEHLLAGERIIIGHLRSKGIVLQRHKIRDSIHRVDPLNAALRWLRSNPRWIYSVPGPNHLWHNDSLHKLVHWGIYIHGCIDGYSRLITYIKCADNNKAKTVLDVFLNAVQTFGLPTHVRGDFGTENNGIEKFMLEVRNNKGGYIRGPSVHNQRIERLHYDTTNCVLSHYIDLFLSMEENRIHDRNNLIDLLALHFVYIPQIQKSLDIFMDAWNHHSLSTEKNKTPYQLFTLGMADENKKDQCGVTSFLAGVHNDIEAFGVDIISSSVFEEDVKFKEIKDFEAVKAEVFPILGSKFPQFNDKIDDGNFGIDFYLSVKHAILDLFDL